MSKMANPAGTRSLGTSRRSAARSRLGATTAPRGRISFAPALARMALARSSLSRSTSEPPTPNPMARKNVLAIAPPMRDRKSTRLNSSHDQISYAVFCLKKKKKKTQRYLALDNPKVHNEHHVEKHTGRPS